MPKYLLEVKYTLKGIRGLRNEGGWLAWQLSPP